MKKYLKNNHLLLIIIGLLSYISVMQTNIEYYAGAEMVPYDYHADLKAIRMVFEINR